MSYVSQAHSYSTDIAIYSLNIPRGFMILILFKSDFSYLIIEIHIFSPEFLDRFSSFTFPFHPIPGYLSLGSAERKEKR